MLSTSFEKKHLHKLQKCWTVQNFSSIKLYKFTRRLLTTMPNCQLQYVSKSETFFNIWLSNHRKDSKNKNSILACKYFQNLNHNFQRDAKLTLIEQITKTLTTTKQLPLLLMKRENFWILKLKTIYPDGLNQELNDI